jgi:hypothetical protein
MRAGARRLSAVEPDRSWVPGSTGCGQLLLLHMNDACHIMQTTVPRLLSLLLVLQQHCPTFSVVTPSMADSVVATIVTKTRDSCVF